MPNDNPLPERCPAVSAGVLCQERAGHSGPHKATSGYSWWQGQSPLPELEAMMGLVEDYATAVSRHDRGHDGRHAGELIDRIEAALRLVYEERDRLWRTREVAIVRLETAEAEAEGLRTALREICDMAGSNTVPLPPIAESPAGYGAIYRKAADALRETEG